MIASALALALLADPISTTPPDDDVVLDAMRDELARTVAMKLDDAPAPYQADTTVIDLHMLTVQASFGALVDSELVHARVIVPRVRVGDFDLDAVGAPMQMQPPLVAFEDDYDALRHALWRATDSAYKIAATGWRQAKVERAQTVADPDRPDAFTRRDPIVTVVAPRAAGFDRAALERLAERASAEFRAYDHLDDAQVELVVHAADRRYVASDGTIARDDRRALVIRLAARSQADDGDLIGRSEQWVGALAQPPTEAELAALTKRIADDLAALRHAPVVKDYNGPVLFEGEAAADLVGVVVAQQLVASGGWGGDVESRMGQLVLPRGASLVDDPALTRLGSSPLLGGYVVDDEGTRAERVVLVDDGKLVSLLSGRTPGKKVKRSNGHARGPLGFDMRPAPSNLVLASRKGVGPAALQKRLLALVHARGAEFGLVVAKGGGFGRPELVYRVGKDGKRTLVRTGGFGMVELDTLRQLAAIGTTATVVHRMQLAGMPTGGRMPIEMAAFTTPLSVAAPALVVTDLELHGFGGGNPKPPAYPRPAFHSR